MAVTGRRPAGFRHAVQRAGAAVSLPAAGRESGRDLNAGPQEGQRVKEAPREAGGELSLLLQDR